MINVERYIRSIYTEKEGTHYVSVVLVVSPIYFERDASPTSSPTLLSNSMRPVLIFTRVAKPSRYFRVQFYAPATISIYLKPSRIYTSGQIDPISILLRSAGGRGALSCWTKLIVSLRCETILRDLPRRSRLIARRSVGDRSFHDNYQPRVNGSRLIELVDTIRLIDRW